jgi:hypothetical protein
VIEAGSGPEAGHSDNSSDFRRVFVGRVHEVLEQGYLRLDAASYVSEEEPAITGDLAKAMKAFLGEASAPDWADHFSVHDDPPVNDGTLRGKRRKRIDFRVDSARPRPGTSFSFEAKRLAPAHTVSAYLGEEGLGCFLCGDYAREDDIAGMVGYMQSEDAEYWSRRIGTALRENDGRYEVSGAGTWEPLPLPRGPKHVFRSTHKRIAVGSPIDIWHSLLEFTATRVCDRSSTRGRGRTT